jgi:hypothetical protein
MNDSSFSLSVVGRKGFLCVLTLAPHRKVVLVTRLQISPGVEVAVLIVQRLFGLRVVGWLLILGSFER